MSSKNDHALLIRIVSRLEEHGLPADSYQLYDVIDPDALAALVESADADLQISFEVHGFHVEVFGDGHVIVLDDWVLEKAIIYQEIDRTPRPQFLTDGGDGHESTFTVNGIRVRIQTDGWVLVESDE